jgi:GNAT superfamily N-acetyltransferase
VSVAAISVRVAGDGDLAVLASLRRTWTEENAGGPIEDDNFGSAFADWVNTEGATRTYFVVERDGQPIGMANVKRYQRMPVPGRPSGGWWGYVGNVFVLEQFRNEGVGDALMRALADWSFANGAEHLRLAPSPRSWPFYTRLGFTDGSVVELDPPT